MGSGLEAEAIVTEDGRVHMRRPAPSNCDGDAVARRRDNVAAAVAQRRPAAGPGFAQDPGMER
ncbi:hypothetical protein GCM10010532_019430 [Dactylosporangium siamense]|uniref:Uncharacterized protein n=1 Tax=Dactylosporangium siamense TaxID=685454 RepID=A0A919Q1F4_9ACTN|nr:hypothetical protein Dsi01nite_105140 [Dactylosporangium siamense]